MAHYAFINNENIVVEVIVGRNEDEVVGGISDWEEYYGSIRGMKCLRTSYNGNIRKQFAGIGFRYDPDKDIFIGIQPYPSWSLNENSDWVSPIPPPEDQIVVDSNGDWVSGLRDYFWDENSQTWVEHFTLDELSQ
jgi:hypothetical protein